jgi:hypothetical protein
MRDVLEWRVGPLDRCPAICVAALVVGDVVVVRTWPSTFDTMDRSAPVEQLPW